MWNKASLFLWWRVWKWTRVLKCVPSSVKTEGQSLGPAGSAISNAEQDAIGFLGHLGTAKSPWPQLGISYKWYFPFLMTKLKMKKIDNGFHGIFKWISPFSLNTFFFLTDDVYGRTSRKCVATATLQLFFKKNHSGYI